MKKIIRITNKLSFRNKLMLSYILLIFIPVATIGIAFYRSMIKYVSSNSLKIIEQQMDHETVTVVNKIREIEKTGYLMSTNEIINKFFKNNYYGESEMIQVINNRIYPLISWFEATSNDIGNIRFLTNNENIPESKFISWEYRFTDEEWLENVKVNLEQNINYWESLHSHRAYFWDYSDANSKSVFSLFYRMSQNDSLFSTYLEIETTPDYLFDSINLYPIGQTGYTIIIDEEYEILAGEKNGLHNDMLDSEDFKKIQQLGDGTFHFIYNAREYYISLNEIKPLDFNMVTIVPINEITEPISKLKNIALLFFVSGSILLLLLSYFTAGLLLKRIKAIVAAVRKIQNEDFDIKIPVKGNDEIDKLAHDVNKMSSKINELFNKIYKAELLQKETALNALQAQMNPHFLFNSLETIKMMAELKGEEIISDSITALGNLLRHNTQIDDKFVTLENSLKNIVNYVKIQNLMLNNSLDVKFEIDPDLSSYRIPNFILQPLVENSIVHGFKNHETHLQIEIIARISSDIVHLIVKDNGDGIDSDQLSKIKEDLLNNKSNEIHYGEKHSIALNNIDSRIKMYYGENFGLEIDNLPDKGSITTIKLPQSSMQSWNN